MGGGTSSYQEAEETDCVLLWGSNARETHPIFFHHLLKGLKRGARMYAIDPRRTSSAAWADVWVGLDVGTDIALANAVGREIIAAGLANHDFITHATEGFEAYRASVEPWTAERAEAATGVPAAVIRDMARAYATAPRAMICWTLGITEHHYAVDNVLSLINLALLTGHVGRWGSGINPLRGQNNVQGGGDMGALPDRLPGFQHVENDAVRARFDAAWGVAVPPARGWHLSGMFDAMERGDLKAVYVIGENPVQSEADQHRATHLLGRLEFLVVQDLFLTDTAQLADVVFPAAAGAFESDGTVTSSERRVQRCRRTIDPPGEARDDLRIIFDLARAMGHDWGVPDRAGLGRAAPPVARPRRHELRPARRASRAALAVLRRAAPRRGLPARAALGAADQGASRPVPSVDHQEPADALTAEYGPPDHRPPPRRVQHRRADRRLRLADPPRETLDLSPEDAAAHGLEAGERVRVVSRRGAVEVPVFIDPSLRPGLAFMTFHFPDQVPTNQLTIDAQDPKAGTAEFKATAVRIEKLPVPALSG